VLPDGSRLTPLLPPGTGLDPVTESANGAIVAYTDRTQAIYVSRADGIGLRRLVRSGGDFEGFSPDAKWLAFTKKGIWIVGTDGTGLRRMTSYGDDGWVDWAPDGQSFVFSRYADDGSYSIIVQPLRGRRRVLFRTSPDFAGSPFPNWSPDGRSIIYLIIESNQRKNGLWVMRKDGKLRHRVAPGLEEDAGASFAWSPDGRWIADVEQSQDAERLNGLWLVRPDGKGRHRVTPDDVSSFQWSPDSKRIAYATSENVLTIAGVDGTALGELPLGVRLESWLSWSPDGSRLAFSGRSGDDPEHLWTVNSDLTGLRRLTSEGSNGFFGWTQLDPVLPPAPPIPPTERVLGADVVATDAPVAALAADGGRVAFVTEPTKTDCDHVTVWTPAARALRRFGREQAPCSTFSAHPTAALALAGSRIAWTERSEVGEGCSFELKSAQLAAPAPVVVSADEGIRCDFDDPYALRGHGDLLVFDHDSRLIRIGGSQVCGDPSATASICATLRRGDHFAPVDSVSGRLIAVREREVVAVVDDQGRLVRLFPFLPADVNAARLDEGNLVVWRFGVLEVYDVTTGALELSRPLPSGFRLTDVDGGIAVLRSTDTVELLRLEDGRTLELKPGLEPTLADLEPPGLYYSYATSDGGGRVVFVPRAEIVRSLDGGAR
jgi:Tol biopolymer transport system component